LGNSADNSGSRKMAALRRIAVVRNDLGDKIPAMRLRLSITKKAPGVSPGLHFRSS
jgi:hypothetical protein